MKPAFDPRLQVAGAALGGGLILSSIALRAWSANSGAPTRLPAGG